MTNLNLGAADLEAGICFRVDMTSLIAECSLCSENDYVFGKAWHTLEGDAIRMDDSWLTSAAVHLNKYHPDMME